MTTFDPSAPAPPRAIDAPPRSLTWATNLALGLTCYAAGMAILLVPVGLFVGPHILAGAGIHGAVAAVLFAATRGLQRRSDRARWLLMALSAIGMIAIPTAMAINGPGDRVGWIFFGLVSLYFAAMLGASSRPSAATWCSGLPSPGRS